MLALSLSRDEQTLYSGSWDHTVRVWRTADKVRPLASPRARLGAAPLQALNMQVHAPGNHD